MPRGFLVKRTKKACGSYRIPCEEPQSLSLPSGLDAATTFLSGSSPPSGSTENEQPMLGLSTSQGASRINSELSPINTNTRVEQMRDWTQLPHSQVQPTELDIKNSYFKRSASSPTTGESFPLTSSFASVEKLLGNHNPFMTPEGKLNGSVRESGRSSKFPPKKNKVTRKLNFADEVTTSPVLGLKIKAEDPDIKSRNPLSRRAPLGEFICQLCKEQYPDPLALAQHKCSRIVRVEYRCPECDKIFSCPANLASHRRWHKPRATGSDGGKKLQPPLEGKENSNVQGVPLNVPLNLLEPPNAQLQHQQPADSSQLLDQPRPPPSGSAYPSRADTVTPLSHAASEGEEESFDCPYCHKRFRRHAYLRKHLLTHPPYSPLERGQLTFPCTLCGVHFPSVDIRDKHRLWHAVREELLIPLEEAMVAEGGQQIYPCERCPTAFFSSPRLSLHMNKCHAAESRQDLAQPLPLGSGC